ncbi:MAG: glycosyltransferase family 4 protein [Anaerolineaceae bacterium]|nr:glycosyltransferase family 4 protein [Anaerolineaceae bacterium]
MHIAIAAPIDIHRFADYVSIPSTSALPKGMGGYNPTDIALELLSRGNRLSIITLDPTIEIAQRYTGEHVDIYIGRYRGRGRDRMKDFFKAEREFVTSSALEAKPDVINAHWSYEYALGAIKSKISSVITVHDAPVRVLQLDFSLYRFVRLIMAIQVFKNSKNFVVVSKYISDHIKKYFCVSGSIQIIPNGLQDTKFQLVPTNKKSRSERFVFFSIANGWSKLKNEKRLIEAFKIVHEENPSTELWMFGIGHEPGGIANSWAIQKKLSGGVRFLGHLPHDELMGELKRSADALVHPSLEESFGNVLIEAMSMGIPVIGGVNSGAVPNVLGYGQAGILVDVRHSQELALAMLKLVRDFEFSRRLGEAGRVYAFENYRLSRVVDLYEKCLFDCIASGEK